MKYIKEICTCFTAPRALHMLLYWLYCFDYSKRSRNKLNSSKYAYIRENCIEYNNPEIHDTDWLWFDSACFRKSMEDEVIVIYFTDVPRPCNRRKSSDRLKMLLWSMQESYVRLFRHTILFLRTMLPLFGCVG